MIKQAQLIIPGNTVTLNCLSWVVCMYVYMCVCVCVCLFFCLEPYLHPHLHPRLRTNHAHNSHFCLALWVWLSTKIECRVISMVMAHLNSKFYSSWSNIAWCCKKCGYPSRRCAILETILFFKYCSRWQHSICLMFNLVLICYASNMTFVAILLAKFNSFE
jgi:hypothetical protein